MINVSFYRKAIDSAEYVHLFSEYLSYVPSVGEYVSYSFEVLDEQDWDREAFLARSAAGKLVDGWRVTKVFHCIRRLGIKNTTAYVCVYLEPVT